MFFQSWVLTGSILLNASFWIQSNVWFEAIMYCVKSWEIRPDRIGIINKRFVWMQPSSKFPRIVLFCWCQQLLFLSSMESYKLVNLAWKIPNSSRRLSRELVVSFCTPWKTSSSSWKSKVVSDSFFCLHEKYWNVCPSLWSKNFRVKKML